MVMKWGGDSGSRSCHPLGYCLAAAERVGESTSIVLAPVARSMRQIEGRWPSELGLGHVSG